MEVQEEGARMNTHDLAKNSYNMEIRLPMDVHWVEQSVINFIQKCAIIRCRREYAKMLTAS